MDGTDGHVGVTTCNIDVSLGLTDIDTLMDGLIGGIVV